MHVLYAIYEINVIFIVAIIVQGKYSSYIKFMVDHSNGAVDSAQLVGLDGKALTSVWVSSYYRLQICLLWWDA